MPGTVKFEISPSHFVFTINQNPAKDSGNSFQHPPQFPKRKKTPSDLRRNALRKAEFLRRKNPTPQAKSDNSPDSKFPIPPPIDKNTISSNEGLTKKDEIKEDISEEDRTPP